MQIRKRNKGRRANRASDSRINEKPTTSVANPPERTVPEIYQVVIECRHEREQQAVFERMRGEGYRCRLMTL
jgi:hypothetical protein